MTASLLQNTLLVGGGATLLAMGLGAMVALLLSSVRPGVRKVVLGGAFVALALPPFLITNAWMHYLGTTGVWRNWLPLNLFTPLGAVLVLSFWLWPISAVMVWAGWQRLEPAHLEVDPALGGWALIRHLLIPLARGPAAVAGFVTFVLAANNLSVPALLQVNVYPATIWLSFSSTFWVDQQGNFDWAKAAGLSWPGVLLPAALLLVVRRRPFRWPTLSAGPSHRLFRRRLGRPWLALAGTGSLMALCGSVVLPVWQLAGNPQTWAQLPPALFASQSAIAHSLGMAAAVSTLCLFLATPVVLRQLQGRRKPRAMSSILWVPFLVPGVLIGIALIQLLNRPFTNWFYQSVGVMILALVIRYIAIGWTTVRHSVQTSDPDLTDAAMLEGASRSQILRHVLWPQLAPQWAAAWAIVFLLCLWDVETIVLILPPGGETVALRVFNLLHYGHTADVNAHCLILLGLALAPLLLLVLLARMRRLGAARWTAPLPVMVAVGTLALMGASGCAPRSTPAGMHVDSRLFDRVEIIATRGIAPGQVNKPRSVAVDHEDNLFVLDFTGRVQKFSPDGEFLLFWQMPETDLGNPKGLSIDPDGNVVVVEPHYSRVNLFTPMGDLLMQWGEKGTNTGQIWFPRAAVVNADGDWFICEYGIVDRVQKFAFHSEPPAGLQFVAAYGRAGSGPGEFNRAEGLAIDAQGRLLVADAVNHRIQILSSDGVVLGGYGSPGTGPGELSYPYDVCADSDGRTYVSEFGNSRVQIFDADGRSLEILGGPGAAPGFFNNPWGIALDSKGNLYVADSRNHRIQKFIRTAGSPIAERTGQNPRVTALPVRKTSGEARSQPIPHSTFRIPHF